MKAIAILKRHPALAAILLIAIALTAAGTLRTMTRNNGYDAVDHEEGAVYVCPMLCVPPSSSPGKCAVCGMNLERVDGASAADMDRPVIAMSERSRALSPVATASAERKAAAAEIGLTGKVVVDETSLAKIAARVAGRIDDLAADFTGKTIRKDEPLFTLYSPQLLSAQEELLQSKTGGQKATITAAREKLRLLGISEKQIADLEKKGAADDHMTFLSPVDGIIIAKTAIEGSYVKEGTELYTVADLAQVWVTLDAYESDLKLLRVGQKAEFATESIPGRKFDAEVTFIDPVLNDMTRAVKVRLEVANKDFALKPGMFVRAKVSAILDATGTPVSAEIEGAMPLVIPASAPLITGKRAVVYTTTETEGEYEGKEVVLGPRVGDDYVVLSGLSEGDRVVVKGNFRIDSAMQIMGKPSMMLPAKSVVETKEVTVAGPQTKCPIMGGAINKDVYIDHGGYRVYFCCAGCDGPFKKDADALIKKMQAEGIVLDRTPTK
jgi:Cu(I)/Ag(I) efflux system membrane fusion protein